MQSPKIMFPFFTLIIFLLTAPSCGAVPSEKNICLLQSNIDKAVLLSTEELIKKFDTFSFVDTRSRVEYEVIHISGASHVSVETMVPEDLSRLLKQTGEDKRIVLYCNGGL